MNISTASTGLRGLIATAIFGALASSCVAVCTAADSTDVLRTIVKYEDLNVSSPQGALALYNRIQAAANQVCQPYTFDRRDLGALERFNACVHKSIADAVTTVNQPALLVVYRSHNRTSQPIIVAERQAP